MKRKMSFCGMLAFWVCIGIWLLCHSLFFLGKAGIYRFENPWDSRMFALEGLVFFLAAGFIKLSEQRPKTTIVIRNGVIDRVES